MSLSNLGLKILEIHRHLPFPGLLIIIYFSDFMFVFYQWSVYYFIKLTQTKALSVYQFIKIICTLEPKSMKS